MKQLVVKLGGEAGLGIMTFGDWVGKLAMRHGLWVFEYPEYPSLIKGGNNTQKIVLSSDEVFSIPQGTDLLVAFDKNTYQLSRNELTENSLIISWEDEVPVKRNSIVVPNRFKQRIFPQSQNSFFFGVLTAVLGFKESEAICILKETFACKNQELFIENKKVFQLGQGWIRSLTKINYSCPFHFRKKTNRLLLSGNEAIALGAIAAGCDYAAIYPMTPISSILHLLTNWQKETGMIVLQPEDEITGINSAIGVSFAGKRAMVATSGGGFCLMTEGFGMAGMSETPLVIIEGQRTGPSTGMPTWTEQGDLQFLINAGQSEFPRIILAPGDPIEAFQLTHKAFWLAEKYQLPVVILTDKFLSESKKTVDVNQMKIDKLIWPRLITGSKNYFRYKVTQNGISPRAVPGNCLVVANSYEHNQQGYSDDSVTTRNQQMNKRLRKLDNFSLKEGVQKYGAENAKLTLVTWGSNKGPALEVLKIFPRTINLINFTQVYPLPKRTKNLFKKTNRFLLIENNFGGQFGRLLRQQIGIKIEYKLLKNDGRPFFTKEIVNFIRKLKL